MRLETVAETGTEAIPRTTRARASNVWRAIFSFPAMLATLLIVLGVITVRSRLDDPDMWWHLKTGEIIWNTHTIPTTDEFSFTTNHHPYVPHEWLAQLTIYGAWNVGGYTGLMAWLCIWTSLLLISGYALCWLYSGNGKVAFLGALTIWLFSTIGLAVRPQMIGYTLLICELLIIHLGRMRDSRWFYALPPLFAVWVNCHGSFFLGLLVLGTFLFCSFFEFRVGLLVCERRAWKPLAVTLALSAAALFVNPIGWSQLSYPVTTMSGGQALGLANSSEWQALSFSDPRSGAWIAVAGVILLLPALRFKELHLIELLLLALGITLAAPHQRMLFVFGTLAAPTLTRLLADAWERYEPERDRWAPNAVLMALSMFLLAGVFPRSNDLKAQVEQNNPVKAVDYIRHSHIAGNMFNEYVYGGYLIWAMPEHQVFVDGRSDVYEWSGVLADFARAAKLEDNPNAVFDKYKVDFCLLSRDSPLARMLALLPNWQKAYSDSNSVIFTRRFRNSPPRQPAGG